MFGHPALNDLNDLRGVRQLMAQLKDRFTPMRRPLAKITSSAGDVDEDSLLLIDEKKG